MDEKLSETLSFKTTLDERYAIEKESIRQGMSTSEFLRAKILGCLPRCQLCRTRNQEKVIVSRNGTSVKVCVNCAVRQALQNGVSILDVPP